MGHKSPKGILILTQESKFLGEKWKGNIQIAYEKYVTWLLVNRFSGHGFLEKSHVSYGSMLIWLHAHMAPCSLWLHAHYGSMLIWLHAHMAPCSLWLHAHMAPCSLWCPMLSENATLAGAAPGITHMSAAYVPTHSAWFRESVEESRLRWQCKFYKKQGWS